MKRTVETDKPNDKRERFRRVAEKRTNKAIYALRSLKACAGNGYDYSEAERDQLIKAVREAVKDLETAFFERGRETTEFKFRYDQM